MKKQNRQVYVQAWSSALPLEAKIPTKITLDADVALRLADMARKTGCSKSDVVNAVLGRYADISNIITELPEYVALGCREW